MCTVHSFPHNIDHCLTWARSEFEGLLEKGPSEANAYLADPTKYTGEHARQCQAPALVASRQWRLGLLHTPRTITAVRSCCGRGALLLLLWRSELIAFPVTLLWLCGGCLRASIALSLAATATDTVKSSADAAAREQLAKVVEVLVADKVATFEDCIAWARLKFQVGRGPGLAGHSCTSLWSKQAWPAAEQQHGCSLDAGSGFMLLVPQVCEEALLTTLNRFHVCSAFSYGAGIQRAPAVPL